MMHARDMVRTYPAVPEPGSEELVPFLEVCFGCAQTCTVCADTCLAEDTAAELRQRTRLDLDCTDLCMAAGKLASRHTGKNREVLRKALRACATACRACGDERETYADIHEHCRICAEAHRMGKQAYQHGLHQIV